MDNRGLPLDTTRTNDAVYGTIHDCRFRRRPRWVVENVEQMSGVESQAEKCAASVGRGGIVESWSAALEELTGWPADYVKTRPVGEFVVALHPASLPSLDVPATSQWSGSIALVVRNQSVPIVCRAKLTPHRSPAGRTQSVRFDIDVSTAPTAQALQRDGGGTSQSFTAVTDVFPGFCYTVDADLVFTSSLGAGLSALRLEPGQLVGMKLTEMWGTRDLSYEPLLCHLRALAGVSQTYRDVCMGRALDYQLRPLVGTNGRVVGVIGVGIDVTDAERQRAETARLAQQLREARQIAHGAPLDGGIVHELNNLLTTVMGNVALAQQKLGEGEVSGNLADAIRGAEAASQVIRELSTAERTSAVGFSRPPLARTSPHELGGGESILLVDDEPSLLEMASETLQQLGYEVVACPSAEDALRVLEASPTGVDLLVTDVVMPRMNGKELAARVRALHPSVAVLFTSGYGQSVVATRGGQPEGVHFVDKPYRLTELAAKVREVLDSRAFSSTGTSAVRGSFAVGT